MRIIGRPCGSGLHGGHVPKRRTVLMLPIGEGIPSVGPNLKQAKWLDILALF